MVININVLRNQLKETPPNTVYLKQLLEIFRDSLFKFVPSKTEVHQFIKDDLPLDTVDTSTITAIVEKLIHWKGNYLIKIKMIQEFHSQQNIFIAMVAILKQKKTK